MNDKLLRTRLNKIRDAMTLITKEINAIYNDNAEVKDINNKDTERIKEDKWHDSIGDINE